MRTAHLNRAKHYLYPFTEPTISLSHLLVRVLACRESSFLKDFLEEEYKAPIYNQGTSERIPDEDIISTSWWGDQTDMFVGKRDISVDEAFRNLMKKASESSKKL